ncbi:Pyruvate/Phosphoenolpyruvate kinase-like domain-containing protein [Russula earlei]|uniref:Pyruvate/Phosphoenolpyruvate kinase-like domain-containing protein n=1 Tax=Russula earlei TaxID=71964 RepID=A0ACC0U8N4_9AGAM|nr:Pyruvate/Phosphoenolpyruvate kinase-like domain-containing protein [Russula earlei]
MRTTSKKMGGILTHLSHLAGSQLVLLELLRGAAVNESQLSSGVYYNPRLCLKNYLEGPLSWNPVTRLRQMLAFRVYIFTPMVDHQFKRMLLGMCDSISARCALEAGFTCLYQSAQMVCGLDPTVPVIADADTGFGGPAMVARTVIQYMHDQVRTKHAGAICPESKANPVIARDTIPGGSNFVIIGRTDSAQVFGMEEAVIRLKLAADACNASLKEGVKSKELLESSVQVLVPKPVLVNVVSGGLAPSFTLNEAVQIGAVIFSLVSSVAAVHGIRAARHAIAQDGVELDAQARGKAFRIRKRDS